MVNVRVTDGSNLLIDGGNGGDNGDGTRGGFRDVSSSAITYVMSQRRVQSFTVPTPQYLTAVYNTLTTNFPELSDRPIEICDYTGERARGQSIGSLVGGNFDGYAYCTPARAKEEKHVYLLLVILKYRRKGPSSSSPS